MPQEITTVSRSTKVPSDEEYARQVREEARDRNEQTKRDLMKAPDMPSLPPPAKRDLPRPAKAGDAVHEKEDVISETNYIPGMKSQPGMGRGLTSDDLRHEFGADVARRETDAYISQGSYETKEAIRKAIKGKK